MLGATSHRHSRLHCLVQLLPLSTINLSKHGLITHVLTMHLTRISTQHTVCTRAFVYRLSKRPSRTRRTRRLSRTRRRRRKKRGSPTLMTTTGRMTSRASLSRRRRRERGRRSSPTQRTSFKAKYILRSVHIGIHMYLTTGKYKHVLCANCITLSVSTTIKTNR